MTPCDQADSCSDKFQDLKSFSEGLAQKAQKGLRLLRAAQKNGFETTGWDFLDGYLEYLMVVKNKMISKRDHFEKKELHKIFLQFLKTCS